jgi:hypothetical protein
VIITLSDPRGYGVLRTALDVKHTSARGDTPESITSATLVDGEDPYGIDIDRKGKDIEEERGRPRSKEDAKVLVMAHETGKTGIKSKVSPRRRPDSRGKKIGFLEGWFGLGGGQVGDARSSSSPPTSNIA